MATLELDGRGARRDPARVRVGAEDDLDALLNRVAEDLRPDR